MYVRICKNTKLGICNHMYVYGPICEYMYEYVSIRSYVQVNTCKCMCVYVNI